MKTLVVYYSLTGNTKRMAEIVAEELDARVQPLVPLNDIPRRGLRKYWHAARQTFGKACPELQPLEHDPQTFDRLVIGTPVWAGSYAPALRSFLSACRIEKKEVAFFCCHGGGKGPVFKRLREAFADCTVTGECDFLEPLRKAPEDAERKAREWAGSLRAD